MDSERIETELGRLMDALNLLLLEKDSRRKIFYQSLLLIKSSTS